jgi:hypothetical protein
MEPSQPAKEYMTLRELEAFSGRSKTSLRRDVKRGRLQAIQPAGRRGGKLLFHRDAIKKFLASPGEVPVLPTPARLPGRQPAWTKNSPPDHPR